MVRRGKYYGASIRWNDILFWVPEKKKKTSPPHPISSIIYLNLSMKMSVPMHGANGYVRKGRAYIVGLFYHVPSNNIPIVGTSQKRERRHLS